MKKVLLFSFIVACAITSKSQTPSWEWAQCGGGGNYCGGVGVTISNSGHLYLGARFAQTCTFGVITANGPGANNVLHGRFDTSGLAQCKWLSADNFSSGEDYAYGFAMDNRENTYLVGTINSGYGGLYLDKYDSSGNKIWAYNPTPTYTTTQMPAAYGVASDNSNDSGNTYIVGEYYYSITFATSPSPTVLNAVGGSDDIFLAKIDSNGNPIWAVSAGGTGTDGGRGIAIDPNGYVYICGSYNGTATFGTLPPTPAAGSSSSLFVAKYDRSGHALWVNTATNAGFIAPEWFWRFQTMTVDSCGNSYVTGTYINTAQFGSNTLTCLAGANGNIFIAKLLTNGNWEWVKSAGGTGGDGAISVALDKYSDVYVSGAIGSATAKFDNITVTNSAAPQSNVFVAKYSNSNGAAEWVLDANETGGTGDQGIAVDSHGYIYISGSVSGTATLGPSTITSSANGNVMLAKIDTVPLRAIIPDVSPTYCPGSTVSLPYTIIGTFDQGNTFTAQLSDSTGSFANAKNIGDTLLSTAGSINITIPNGTPPGTYLIRVVSDSPATSSWANGCGAYYNSIYINDFYVTIGSNLGVTITPDSAAVCNGSSVLLKANGGGSSFTYTWSNGANTDTTTVNPTTDTSYIVTVSNGFCSGNDTVKVKVNTAPPLTIQPASPIVCSGLSTSLTVPVSGTNYTWTPSTGLNITSGDTVLASPTVSTTYTVTGTDSLGCSVTGSDIVSVNTTVPLNIQPPSPAADCNGQPIILSVPTSGKDYSWSPSTYLNQTTGDTVTATPVANITYTVSGVDSLGCNVLGTEVISLSSGPSKPTISEHDSVLISSSTQSNQWLRNDTAILGATNQDYIVTISGYYQVAVSNPANGCSTTSDSIFVSGINQLSAISNQLSIYPNPFNSNIVVNISSSVGDLSNWSLQIIDVLGRVTYTKSSLNYSNDIDLSNLSSGMYFITVINKTGRGVFPVVKQN